jgi:hypothetical protein
LEGAVAAPLEGTAGAQAAAASPAPPIKMLRLEVSVWGGALLVSVRFTSSRREAPRVLTSVGDYFLPAPEALDRRAQ